MENKDDFTRCDTIEKVISILWPRERSIIQLAAVEAQKLFSRPKQALTTIKPTLTQDICSFNPSSDNNF